MSSTPTDDSTGAWTFDASGPRVFMPNEGDIVFYTRGNDAAWLACQDAPHVHAWR